ncbi:hypothetical protein Q8A67_008099 [Cirrhinus molitorella]|uniref:Uncharacterized protein n=1 Tax=Cirrhinus molitorella TaxID=172907 RepID=A0AA88TU59_9TELE|nr:hypothetical protein Q8A67_008099 [Cirrhinus molitorella]
MCLLLRPADLLRLRELVSSMEQCTPKLQGQWIIEAPCSSSSPSVWFPDPDYRQTLTAALTVEENEGQGSPSTSTSPACPPQSLP